MDRLIREDNVRLGKTYTFEYDNNGNILNKNTYQFTNAIDPISSQGPYDHTESSYGYTDTGNRDRLLVLNDEHFDYDALGNPATYRNKSLTWDNLRDLVQYGDMRFSYDASGLRQSKSLEGSSHFTTTETKYHWAGSQLLAETRTSAYEDLELNDPLTNDPAYANASIINISYIQGANGLTGFIVSGSGNSGDRTYYYRKNIHGDVTHIFDHNGNIAAEYVYDAWGNHTIITDIVGIDESVMAYISHLKDFSS